MDQNQQKMVNEAAEKFAGAIKESYQALADRSVSPRRSSTRSSPRSSSTGSSTT
jgi:hypothetical protein